MKERDLKILELSPNRFRELKYFCRQYREKQSQLRSITELSSPSFGGSGGSNKISDRTADTACRKACLSKDIEMIEQAAIEADAEIYPYIISNVADGVSYEFLDVPASIATFYRKRKKFFRILDRRKR